VTSTLMGLGAFPADDPKWLGMLGMHGAYEANMATHGCDVMLAVGSRFDDRVTGRLDAFSPASRKIHIDIDPSSINKTVPVEVGIVGDCASVLEAMLARLRARRREVDQAARDAWRATVDGWRARRCFAYKPDPRSSSPSWRWSACTR
jgi:acetolactate synthase-1/2/3 large subunit